MIMDQYSITANELTQVNLAIRKIGKILITHCSNSDCRMLKLHKCATSWKMITGM